ncbi:UDP-2,4-diacetamido-2,4,6-trideoxy-beta-L-altropyranose hydrolase [Methanobrevibacter sp. OttesenSCG-928-K11]|nr:UDP-2,4-diacetamido-2,4,6-trideoxy-beta-L-altropyranose hydrolase [Methanobrevibacter sp. OttesenSCG-928-K11]MDL2271308.1 UDP-2,4-diacetamido-2,4,6-trideoxy-beta-L-altropyranose hydrolase [Methanobrevibacter sp. OttesenSCG-928-I08]
MFNNDKILVVIPARGGSKGIPRKNCRILGERPLISYAIDMANASKYVDDVIVSTEDGEIRQISEKFGATVVGRPPELSTDEVPLDPVIFDAVLQKEKMIFDEYDIVITVQPTSPLLKTKTLDHAIEKFDSFDIDTVISVVDDRHLRWAYDHENKKYFPLYKQRLNRQYLPETFRETGSILASRRRFITEDSRLGDNIDLIKISTEESIDIDNYEDWWIAENIINKKRIAIKVDAYDEIGTGHIYRCVSIASKLYSHDVVFILNEKHKLGIDIIKKYNYPFVLHEEEDEIFKILDKFKPDIVINDILDTSKEYIYKLKMNDYFVINFEDLGEGSESADLVFDALYEHKHDKNNVYSGYNYYILKEEFFYQKPKVIREDVSNILLTFGGTDPNNFTEKVIDSILYSGYSGEISVILGIGYRYNEEIQKKYYNVSNVKIFENVKSISDYMAFADLIFTSAGRTMYEVCSLGVPCICLCQNERELSHTFANLKNGFINMGLGKDIEKEEIIEQLDSLIDDYEMRKAMNQRMLAIDLKHGFDNIMTMVTRYYRNVKLKKQFNN